MKVCKTIKEIQDSLKSEEQPIALIPTMGALHKGHISLIEKAKSECKTVVVYVYVNPLQFSPNEDFNSYPRDIESDIETCKGLGVDFLFTPESSEVFPDIEKEKKEVITPPHNFTSLLCGKSRKGHFEGVATVLKRFFEIIGPDKVYFGEKDRQQLYIVQWLIDEFKFPIELVSCPIVRDISGLALSSRNSYLNDDQIETAARIYKALEIGKVNIHSGIFTVKKALLESLVYLSNYPEVKVEYLEARDKDSLKEVDNDKKHDFYVFIAAKIGNVRLIDNIEV